jgi:hypothetical protein
MTTTRARALALVLALLGVLAACGGDDGGGDDGVASLDENAAADDESGSEEDDEGGGGSGEPPSDAEAQDAMLEYAQCMRDNGIDMPDPEFDENGGAFMATPAPEEGGPGEAEFEAANEECQPILDETMGEIEVDPEQQAEMQDQLVAMAECMRERGHDFPDPEVDSEGRVQMRGPEPEEAESDEEFQADIEECNEEAGMDGEGGVMIGGPAGGGGDA